MMTTSSARPWVLTPSAALDLTLAHPDSQFKMPRRTAAESKTTTITTTRTIVEPSSRPPAAKRCVWASTSNHHRRQSISRRRPSSHVNHRTAIEPPVLVRGPALGDSQTRTQSPPPSASSDPQDEQSPPLRPLRRLPRRAARLSCSSSLNPCRPMRRAFIDENGRPTESTLQFPMALGSSAAYHSPSVPSVLLATQLSRLRTLHLPSVRPLEPDEHALPSGPGPFSGRWETSITALSVRASSITSAPLPLSAPSDVSSPHSPNQHKQTQPKHKESRDEQPMLFDSTVISLAW
ncbi:hypothetical protein K456DRAFT_800900 [Colletotrichum gloeosporioides 23]|nr:hypothetical protein K456DRAFT_800900 [Colletotrichum gloeosporioides 23]